MPFRFETPLRQQVHVVYGGANLFTPNISSKLGGLALRSLEQYGPFPNATKEVMARVREKLRIEPVEDYRVDFEDGYGRHTDDEEDAHALKAAALLAEGFRDGILPPFIGIRTKAFDQEHRARARRTFQLFIGKLLDATAGKLPEQFVVTIPKTQTAAEVMEVVAFLEDYESKHGLPNGSFRFEILVETPSALLSLPRILDAAAGRCRSAHLGAYDYLSSIDVAATEQSLTHPSCDFARHMMQASLCGRGVFLSDGVTNQLPVGGSDSVHQGWLLHERNIRHALAHGFYQGWDLHPAQLVSRYATIYSFFRAGWEKVLERLRNFQEKSERATLTGSVFDDAATVRGLTAFLGRAVQCGAIGMDEIEAFPKPS